MTEKIPKPRARTASAKLPTAGAFAGDPAASILPDQRQALRAIFATTLGFRVARPPDDPGMVEAVLDV